MIAFLFVLVLFAVLIGVLICALIWIKRDTDKLAAELHADILRAAAMAEHNLNIWREIEVLARGKTSWEKATTIKTALGGIVR